MVLKSRQFFLPFRHSLRVWQTDGRTDRQTAFSSLVGAGIPCSVEKMRRYNELEAVRFKWDAHAQFEVG